MTQDNRAGDHLDPSPVLTDTQFRTYALIGASIELERIEAERERIYATFPELRDAVTEAPAPLELVPTTAANTAPARRTLSTAQRKVISRRMRRYWRQRRERGR